MKAQDILADAISSSKELFERFLPGFTEENRTRGSELLPNHVIWTLGHISLFMNHLAGMIDGRPLPESDFVQGDGTAGGAERYDTEAIGFGSQPMDDGARYPTLARGRAIHAAAIERLAAAVRGAHARTLSKRIDWAGTKIPLWNLVGRLMFHSGFHAGELADLRRALGFERVIQFKANRREHTPEE